MFVNLSCPSVYVHYIIVHSEMAKRSVDKHQTNEIIKTYCSSLPATHYTSFDSEMKKTLLAKSSIRDIFIKLLKLSWFCYVAFMSVVPLHCS